MAFQIVEDTFKSNTKFNTSRRSVCFRLNNIPDNVDDPEKWVKNGIKDIVKHIVEDVDSEDRVGFAFESEGFSRGAAHLSFRKASKITFEDVWNLLGKIYQSNSEGFHCDTFRMTMTQVKPYRGTGRVRNYTTFEEESANRRGIISISNKDSLCLVRALVIAIAYAMNVPYLTQVRRNINKRQDTETLKLMQESRVQISDAGATMEHVRKFQNFLKDYKITVYEYGSKGRTVLYEGPDAPLKINLLHYDNHFNVITNLKAAFCCRFYCDACHVPYDHKNDHRCAASCPCCQQTPPCEKTREEVTCTDCNRKFRGLVCYDKHKAPGSCGGKSICEHVKQCSDCLKTIPANKQHACGEIFCKLCEKHMPAGHLCYIKPNTRTPPSESLLFIFYDLETRQDEIGPNGDKIHVPNLCVFQQRCDACIEQDNSVLVCKKCGMRRQIIRSDDVIEPFVHHILMYQKKFSKIIVMAHNGKAYDHQFILKHVLEKTDLKVDLIMRGTSITMMGIDKKIKFIDSINYFPMALAALPKAFDLGPEMKKGYFPHLFNTSANKDYEGSLPALEYYDPDHLNEDARLKLLEWHQEHLHDNFNMQNELVAYCISDVDILTKACLKFRKMFLVECNVCPFTEAVTIASACNLVFRRNFLQPQTIGLIPRHGYRNVDKQSKIATLWLIYEELQRGINIIHSAKQREAVVDGVRVDGYCKETRQIFEFHGCYYHGHTCMTSRRDEALHDDPSDTLNTRLQRTINKTQRLRDRGLEVIEKWECEFREILQNNKPLRADLENDSLMAATPLDPRDAFFGGRTGNCKTYYQVKRGEKIKYVDICSLYPWVCKYGKFPIGHPKVHVGTACKNIDLKKIDGFVKCSILPPQDLYHPVLPLKMNGKLMFVLCRTCGLKMNHRNCEHTSEQRALNGTWVIDEVQKAVEEGYQLLEVFEVWQYTVEQYDAVKKTGGLFTRMMDKFIRIKQEASGWPGHCVTDEQKNAYIEEFFDKEGIRMGFDKILKNPGLRSLAKLMLNSFWYAPCFILRTHTHTITYYHTQHTYKQQIDWFTYYCIVTGESLDSGKINQRPISSDNHTKWKSSYPTRQLTSTPFTRSTQKHKPCLGNIKTKPQIFWPL